jgi:hypothetical protein
MAERRILRHVQVLHGATRQGQEAERDVVVEGLRCVADEGDRPAVRADVRLEEPGEVEAVRAARQLEQAGLDGAAIGARGSHPLDRGVVEDVGLIAARRRHVRLARAHLDEDDAAAVRRPGGHGVAAPRRHLADLAARDRPDVAPLGEEDRAREGGRRVGGRGRREDDAGVRGPGLAAPAEPEVEAAEEQAEAERRGHDQAGQ